MPDTPMTGTAGAYVDTRDPDETSSSGVAWPAILGGAFAALALALILLALGTGFGLASVSPWSHAGASVTTFTITTAIWLIVTQWLASGLGGYLTGRLRTKWVGLHTHEVFFRDTANGFLSWATAAVISGVFLASAASSVVNSTISTPTRATIGDPTAYFVDSLYRTDRPSATVSDMDVRGQSTRILLNGLTNGDIAAPDRIWLAQLVSARTGLSPADAEKRVDGVIAQEKAVEAKVRQAADATRKAGSYLSIFTGLSMVIGAFIACVSAALGGRQRDEY